MVALIDAVDGPIVGVASRDPAHPYPRPATAVSFMTTAMLRLSALGGPPFSILCEVRQLTIFPTASSPLFSRSYMQE